MSNDYWDRRRRQLDEDNKFRREQSKRDLEMFKTQVSIDRLTGEIARREHLQADPSSEDGRNDILSDMSRYRKAALDEIDRLVLLTDQTRLEWRRRLDSMDLWGSSGYDDLRRFEHDVRSTARLTDLRAALRGERPTTMTQAENSVEPLVTQLTLLGSACVRHRISL